MKTKTIALTTFAPKVTATKVEYIIANCSYGDFRKMNDMGVDFVLTGTADIKDGNVTYDESAKKLCRHIKFKDMTNGKDVVAFDYAALNKNSHDGYIVCEEKNIPALTKALQAFFSNESVKEMGLTQPFTLLRTCKQFLKDVSTKATAKDYINEAVSE